MVSFRNNLQLYDLNFGNLFLIVITIHGDNATADDRLVRDQQSTSTLTVRLSARSFLRGRFFLLLGFCTCSSDGGL